MRKVVQYAPNGVVLTFNVGASNLSETLFIALSDEEKSILKGMDGFWLTAQNYGRRSMILGNQAQNVKVAAIKSCSLRKNWATEKLFSEYRELFFSREQYEFFD